MKCIRTFTFGFFTQDQLEDQTNIDENNPEMALDLFMLDFGWGKKVDIDTDQPYVLLLEEEPEEIEDKDFHEDMILWEESNV
jgi:hypothetical protein